MEQIDELIKRIEDLTSRVEALEQTSTDSPDEPLPYHYLINKAFCDKYKFISHNYLGKLIRDAGAYFQGYRLVKNKHCYYNELRVLEYVYFYCPSQRIKNQFRLWYSHYEPLKKAVEQMKARTHQPLSASAEPELPFNS